MADLSDDIIVCRCEDVTLGEIRKVIKEGATTLDEIKRITRAGMGPCQGRTCRLLIMGELAKALGKPISQISPSTYRPPLKAVEMGLLADMREAGKKDFANENQEERDRGAVDKGASVE